MVKRLSLVFLVAVLACEEGAMDETVAVQRDSAGISILEVAPPYGAWSLEQTPVARLGVVDGEPAHQFSDVAYAARLSDGRMVVVDGGSSEVRWYGRDGTFQSRAGGRGEGPGEILQVQSAALTPEDTLVLYDARNQRLTWFGPDGSSTDLRRLELGPGSSISLDPLSEGRLLIGEERLTVNFGGAEYNYARDTLLVMMTSRAADAVDTIMRLPGREATTWVDYADGRPVATRQLKAPFGQVALMAGTGDRIALSGQGRSGLALFDASGRLMRLIRRGDVEPAPVSASLRQEYVAHAVRRAERTGLPESSARESAEERLAFLPDEQTVPPFDRIMTDAAEERIWIRDFLPEWRASEARTWTVHDSTGQVLARVSTPPGLHVTHVSGDHLTGVEQDELGVQYVVVYHLNLPTPTG